MSKPDWTAEKTQYGDCWYIWIHAGEVAPDRSHVVASFKSPSSTMKIPQKVVMMSVAAFAELAHFSEIGRTTVKAEPTP